MASGALHLSFQYLKKKKEREKQQLCGHGQEGQARETTDPELAHRWGARGTRRSETRPAPSVLLLTDRSALQCMPHPSISHARDWVGYR